MDEYEWYDDDEPYLREPYVIVERREPGVGSILMHFQPFLYSA